MDTMTAYTSMLERGVRMGVAAILIKRAKQNKYAWLRIFMHPEVFRLGLHVLPS